MATRQERTVACAGISGKGRRAGTISGEGVRRPPVNPNLRSACSCVRRGGRSLVAGGLPRYVGGFRELPGAGRSRVEYGDS